MDEQGPWSPGGQEPPPGVPTFVYGPVGRVEPLVPPPTPSASPRRRSRRAPSGPPVVAALVVLLVLAAVAAAVLVLRGGEGDHLDPAGTDQVRDQSGPRREPDEAWQADLDCGDGGTSTSGDLQIDTSTPSGCEVTADEQRVYVVTRGGTDLHLDALDGRTGDRSWRVDLPGHEAFPIVVGDLVLADGYEDDGSDVVVAVDAASGEEAWRTPGAATALGDDRTTLVARFDGGQERLAAIDLRTGEDRWTAGAGVLDVCGDVVLAADGSNVLAYDLADGDERWRDPKGGAASVVCDAGRAYVQEGTELTARTVADGEERWTATVGEDARVDLLGSVVVGTTAEQAVAYDPDDGEERWTLDLADRDDDLLIGWTPITASTSLVTWGARLDLVDDATGRRLASEGAGDDVQVARTEGLVVRLDDGQAAALALGGLERVWARSVADDATAIALGGGRLYVVGRDTLTAYR